MLDYKNEPEFLEDLEKNKLAREAYFSALSFSKKKSNDINLFTEVNDEECNATSVFTNSRCPNATK